MSIELVEGEDLVLVTGLESVTGMATDGYYVPAERYAKEMNIRLDTVRLWKRRNRIEAISLFGRNYVKQWCEPNTWGYRKMSQKTCKSANPEGT